MTTSETPTSEEINKHYSAAIDSMELINNLLNKTVHTMHELDLISRNVQHLEIMVSKNFWDFRDLEGFKNAISRGNDVLPEGFNDLDRTNIQEENIDPPINT
tara:strand:- start:300 stop:605 length:306 start_codon:yes stop_codon:yes gene_type:complete